MTELKSIVSPAIQIEDRLHEADNPSSKVAKFGMDQPLKLEPWKNKAELVRVPTVYDVAFKAGLKTAHVDWVPTTNAGTFHFEFGERPNAANPIEREMLAAGLISGTELAEFNQRNPPWRDVFWTRAAVHIVKQHRPNLLLFHLLNTDAINHRFGPGTWASASAFAFADTCSTITSGAMVGRCGFVGDIIYSIGVTGFIYPIIGHWAWGPDGWLAVAGFKDFAGSTVVHTIGGTISLAGRSVV